MRILDKLILNESAVTSSLQSVPIDMEQQIGLSVQVDWSSTTASATLTLQVSNDGLTWANLASTASIANNSGTAMLFATDFMYKYARVNVVVASGSITTLKLHVLAKGL